MAEMIYTPDGKGHPLLRPGDFVRIVEEYAGKDVAAKTQQIIARLSAASKIELEI